MHINVNGNLDAAAAAGGVILAMRRCQAMNRTRFVYAGVVLSFVELCVPNAAIPPCPHTLNDPPERPYLLTAAAAVLVLLACLLYRQEPTQR